MKRVPIGELRADRRVASFEAGDPLCFRRGIPIGWARAGIELTVLLIGYLLGGTVGIGTLVFAVGIGPLVALFLPRMSVDPVPPDDRTRTDLGEAH